MDEHMITDDEHMITDDEIKITNGNIGADFFLTSDDGPLDLAWVTTAKIEDAEEVMGKTATGHDNRSNWQ